MAATRFTGTTARPCLSSIATPPQWAPPMLPGCESVPCVLGGVNGLSLRSAASMSWQAALASGVGPPASSAVYRSRSEEHTSELQSQSNLECRLLLEKKTHH